jgi:N-acetylmuramoyl-L-alanine amidase
MVIVTAAELNLRSGPGMDRAVLGQVRKGDVLAVIDSVPSWLYIRKADGRYGWVMDRYTKPSGPVG